MDQTTLYITLMSQYDPDNRPVRQFSIIHRLLTHPNASVIDAVQRIQSLAMMEVTSHNWPPNTFLSDFAWHVCSLLMDIATNTPPVHQTRLLEFVIRLQKSPVVDPRTGCIVRYQGERVFFDLPTLSTYVSDFCTFTHERVIPPREFREMENKTAFLAQMTSVADVDYNSPRILHPMDFSHIGYYACCEAFEGEDDDEPGAQWESAVRIACIWFVYAADRLWMNCKHRRAVEPSEPWTTRMGFHIGRWSTWKWRMGSAENRFGTMATQQLVRSAIAQANQAERI